MRLADFIMSDVETILQEWENFARTLSPASVSMTDAELRSHAAVMLTLIAEDLRTPQSLAQQVEKSYGNGPREETEAGEGHGLARMNSRFTIEQLVSEFRALRSSVLRLWGTSGSGRSELDVQDIIRFNEAIDQLLAASVVSFAQAKRDTEEMEAKRRNQFLAMLAHELRNPLAPISNAAALLEVAKGNQAILEKAGKTIARQVTHMASLVDDLLDVSRVTQGRIKIKLEAVDITWIVDSAVEQVTPQIEARHHQLIVSGLPGPMFVQADKKRLVQVLANLLTNAAKYTPEGGNIRLKVEVHDDQVGITVEDDGIGMAPEFVPYVFDLFCQVEQTADRATGGLGLGLTLVKNLVELHGGKVTCSSPGLGKGSCFVIWLPGQAGSQHQLERTGTLLT